MRAGIVFAPVRPARRTATCIATVATLALGTSVALAQQPQPIQPVPAPKASPAPRPVQPAQKAPAPTKQPQQQPAQQAPAPGGEQQAQTDQPPVVYSPWTKFCGKDNNPQAKEVCLTVKEARLETGQFLAGAALIEQAGEEKKLFRITLPLGMQIPQGTRMLLDAEQPMTGRYIVCLPNGCMADFDVTAEFVGKLKKGKSITLQGINLPGQAASYALPLADFAKANEGPATDPKKFEEDQKKLQDELQKKAEEARKRLQASPQGAAPAQKK
jgi:invasion protein IalB